MQIQQAIQALKVRITEDKRQAVLLIPAGATRDDVSLARCSALLKEAGVEWSPAVRAEVEKLAGLTMPVAQPMRLIVARGVEPVHGEDGSVVWHDKEEIAGPADPDACVNHYVRTTYTTVKVGQALGQVTDPTPGVDGRDVTGAVITANRGTPLKLRLDETIILDALGRMTAQIDGVLVRRGELAQIRRCLELPDFVDFSTGNVDFDGDVFVRRGVRDRFEVRASGSVDVGGMIEAATIVCGGDLLARGGMAGRDRGRIQVAGSAAARYLDGVRGVVRGDLAIDREVVNCTLAIGGAVHAPRASVIGGMLAVTGEAKIGVIGSDAGVPTTVVLGSVPLIEPHLVKADEAVAALNARRDALTQENQALAMKETRSPSDKERQTEILYELSVLDEEAEQAASEAASIRRQVEERRTVRLTVTGRLHPDAILMVRGRGYRLRQSVPGPLTITWTPSRGAVWQRGNGRGPLLALCTDAVRH